MLNDALNVRTVQQLIKPTIISSFLGVEPIHLRSVHNTIEAILLLHLPPVIRRLEPWPKVNRVPAAK